WNHLLSCVRFYTPRSAREVPSAILKIMGKINVLIANATHQFSMEDRVIISEAVKDAEIFINESFEFDYDVDVVVTAPSFLMKTIPEDGISGRTYNSRLIVLVINKE